MGSGEIRTDPELDLEVGVGLGSSVVERWGRGAGGPRVSASPAFPGRAASSLVETGANCPEHLSIPQWVRAGMHTHWSPQGHSTCNPMKWSHGSAPCRAEAHGQRYQQWSSAMEAATSND